MKLLDCKNKRENETRNFKQKDQMTYHCKKIKTCIRFLKKRHKEQGHICKQGNKV